MTERIAIDTSAAVDFLRPDRPNPPLREIHQVLVPMPVVGELFAGAYISRRPDNNLTGIDQLLGLWSVLSPTVRCARVYGELRARIGVTIGASKRNDLWIAAICIDHDVPLLTNDRGFDNIPRLSVVHW